MKETPVDLILLDIRMPEMDGFKTMSHLKDHYPNVRVIVLTMEEEESMVIKMIRLGANGYLLKNADPEEIYEAIDQVMETGYYFNDWTKKAMGTGANLTRTEKKTVVVPGKGMFTDREIEVLIGICEEKSNDELARMLFISQRTIEGLRQRLLEKTGVRNVVGLVLFALRYGIYTLEEKSGKKDVQDPGNNQPGDALEEKE